MRAAPALLDRDAVGVHQRRKLFEMRNEYQLVDDNGTVIGSANQRRQAAVAFLLRLFSDLDVALPTTLEVADRTGAVELVIHKPWFTWRTRVSSPSTGDLGSISKQIRLGKTRFSLEGPRGAELGEVRARNWRARDFVVLDDAGAEVARVNKQWRGLLTESFTDADSYVVQFSPGVEEPLRSLAFASALVVDLVMKQKDT